MLKDKPIAYIAGALNDNAYIYIQNLHRMTTWAEKVRKLGFAIYVPGWDFLHGLVHGDLDYKDYFNNSQSFLKKADIVFVVPGWENSKGTKKELTTAKEYNISIYYEEKGYQQLKRRKKSKPIHLISGINKKDTKSLCGLYNLQKEQTTINRSEVTCKTCLKSIKLWS